LNGHFVDHWNGPAFTQMRREQRDVFLAGESAAFDPKRYEVIRPQCVEHGACWLKNMYFRADETFYAELGRALDKARRLDRWRRPVGNFVRRVRGLLRPDVASTG
jgi:hypothetical protein